MPKYIVYNQEGNGKWVHVETKHQLCSFEDYKDGNFALSTMLRPGTCYIQLGFLINNWSGNPEHTPGDTDSPFLWKDVSITLVKK